MYAVYRVGSGVASGIPPTPSPIFGCESNPELYTMDMSTLDREAARHVISANLRARLSDLGWTQQRLADETGISPLTINHAVKGRRLPSVLLLRRISTVLDCSIEDLILEKSGVS